MTKLTIDVTSPSTFTTVVTDNDEEVSRRYYADGRNCSYSKESADLVKPYVHYALQSVIDRYRVQDTEVKGEPGFESSFCNGLTTYTQYPNNVLPDLHTMRYLEQREELYAMSDRELCEAVSAHFGSHPVQGSGQKELKAQVAEALKTDGEISLPTYHRDRMIYHFSFMQIQETRLNGGYLECDPHLLERDEVATLNTATLYKIDAALQKEEDGSVSVVGKSTEGGEIKLGSLNDSFLRNNPMNVDRCDAEVELTDFSNRKMKNLKVRVVVNSDEMSGDIMNLDNDMLAGIEQDDAIKM